jgi:hypothetical protein
MSLSFETKWDSKAPGVTSKIQLVVRFSREEKRFGPTNRRSKLMELELRH